MDEFFALLEKIGLEGLRWWRENGRRVALQASVRRELQNYIVAEADLAGLLTLRSQQDNKLIPLHSNHMGSTFFLRPTWNLDKAGAFQPRLQLWVIKSGAPEMVGFRFEFPDRTTGTHAYPHVQLTEEFEDNGGLPKCRSTNLTVTYPAFPLPVRDALDLLLAVYVAVRGYRENSVDCLQQMLRTVRERPLRQAIIEERLPRIAVDDGA